MSEKYEPSKEEIKKAQEMADAMQNKRGEDIMEAEGLEERSQEAQDAFMAGRHQALKMTKDEFVSEKEKLEINELLDKMGLSSETESFIRKNINSGLFSYIPTQGYLGMLHPDENDDFDSYKNKMFEIVEKVPMLNNFHPCPCGPGDKAQYKLIRELKEAVLKKFPNCDTECHW